MKAIIDGKEVLLEGNDPEFSNTTSGTQHISWPLKTFDGTLKVDLYEKQIKMKIVSKKAINWFFDLSTATDAKLPFDNIRPKQIDCSFEGMNYSVKAEKGSFSKPGNGALIRISPETNTIILNLSRYKEKLSSNFNNFYRYRKCNERTWQKEITKSSFHIRPVSYDAF
ncbi:MAG: hypothetical protein WKG06_12300 [Segetibacter sp.]